MGATVTVACKMPHGLHLRLFDHVDQNVPAPGGGMRLERVARQRSEAVTLNGYATPAGQSPRCQVIGGYALTPGVEKDFWDAWIKQNGDQPVVLNKLIFAYEKPDMLKSKAREQRGVKNGLETINPNELDKDLRVPRTPQGKSRVETVMDDD